MSHPTLNANVRNAASALAEAGLLRELHTSLNTSAIERLSFGRVKQTARRRALPREVDRLTRSHPSAELARLLRRTFGVSDVGFYEPDRPAHAVDAAASSRVNRGIRAVYSYEDAALKTFESAEAANVARIYDLPIGYWRAAREILGAEAELNPEWASTIVGPSIRDQSKREERKTRELELATRVVVASSFTADTLRAETWSSAPVSVVGYGAPEVSRARPRHSTGPLKVLYVGSLTQRKGISYLFDAVTAMSASAQLTVVGRRVGDSAALQRNLNQPWVRWIQSIPHGELLEVMSSHDVLVFPSLFEGYGLVITEALSQGLPVIATSHTAAPDIMTDGEDGWIVPIRSSYAIQEKLDAVAADRSRLADMSDAARATAHQLTWDSYRGQIVELVESSLSTESA